MSEAVSAGPLAWGGLLAFLAVMIVVDLKAGSAQKHMTVRTAAIWSGIWVGLSVRLRRGALGRRRRRRPASPTSPAT